MDVEVVGIRGCDDIFTIEDREPGMVEEAAGTQDGGSSGRFNFVRDMARVYIERKAVRGDKQVPKNKFHKAERKSVKCATKMSGVIRRGRLLRIVHSRGIYSYCNFGR